jgi:hypothetical protein
LQENPGEDVVLRQRQGENRRRESTTAGARLWRWMLVGAQLAVAADVLIMITGLYTAPLSETLKVSWIPLAVLAVALAVVGSREWAARRRILPST